MREAEMHEAEERKAHICFSSIGKASTVSRTASTVSRTASIFSCKSSSSSTRQRTWAARVAGDGGSLSS